MLSFKMMLLKALMSKPPAHHVYNIEKHHYSGQITCFGLLCKVNMSNPEVITVCLQLVAGELQIWTNLSSSGFIFLWMYSHHKRQKGTFKESEMWKSTLSPEIEFEIIQ